MKIEYQVESLDKVIKYFGDGFTPKPGTKIRVAEWFLDPVKKQVVFAIVVEVLLKKEGQ